MTQRVLTVTGDEKSGWCVRLDGVEVVSFVGPHAQQWAFREWEELAQLLDAQPCADQYRYERTDAGYQFPITP